MIYVSQVVICVAQVVICVAQVNGTCIALVIFVLVSLTYATREILIYVAKEIVTCDAEGNEPYIVWEKETCALNAI